MGKAVDQVGKNLLELPQAVFDGGYGAIVVDAVAHDVGPDAGLMHQAPQMGRPIVAVGDHRLFQGQQGIGQVLPGAAVGARHKGGGARLPSHPRGPFDFE